MNRPGSRHHTEEELLMHFLQEETPEVGKEVSLHLRQCSECEAILEEYGTVVAKIKTWAVPALTEEVWESQRIVLLAHFRDDLAGGKRSGFIASIRQNFVAAWNYALEHPLPTLAYITVAVAFALERTVSTFRLDRILPGASQVFEFFRQVF